MATFIPSTPLSRRPTTITRPTNPLTEPRTRRRSPSTPSATLAPPNWSPQTWRSHPILQQPVYPDNTTLQSVEARLHHNPPLVFPGEVTRLKSALAKASTGHAFILQGGDCAESFDDFHATSVESTFRTLVAQSLAMSYISGLPTIKIGRMAGQFAKPRSKNDEQLPGGPIPVYRGDIVNSAAQDAEKRVPDPERLLRAYAQSAATLNMLRALAKSTMGIMEWLEVINRLTPTKYGAFVERIDDALNFLSACGLDVSASVEGLQNMREPEFYTSHEALLLPYEAALTREVDDGWYCASAHMLWVGERTRQVDGAHVEFLRGINNPVGVKIGPTVQPEELLQLLDLLNPNNEPGKIVVIIRMGADKVQKGLPPLLRAVKREGRSVVWSIDPMHGNTISIDGVKTRPFDTILREVHQFFEAHEAEGTIAGGLHLEMTGDETVTECLGGAVNEVTKERLKENYTSMCDPRLNAAQSLEMAFEVGQMLRPLAKKMRDMERLMKM